MSKVRGEAWEHRSNGEHLRRARTVRGGDLGTLPATILRHFPRATVLQCCRAAPNGANRCAAARAPRQCSPQQRIGIQTAITAGWPLCWGCSRRLLPTQRGKSRGE